MNGWLGPAIGPEAYEVGDEVYESFVSVNSENASAFVRNGDRWLANLYSLARMALARTGITQVSGGDHCTFTDQEKFFSYRRENETGRMVTLIWLNV